MPDLAAITVIPDNLNMLAVMALLAISLVGSFLSVVCGVGGGVLVLSGLTIWLPISTVVPLHAAIQLGSNLARGLISLAHIRIPVFLAFGLASLLGVGIGAMLLKDLSPKILQVIIGLFILYSVWGKLPSRIPTGWKITSGIGILTGMLGMLVGATGMMVAAYLRTFNFDRLSYVGTLSTCLASQNLLKCITFSFLGFVYWEYFTLLLAMIITGFTGTIIGRFFIIRIDEKFFQISVALVLTALAGRLIWLGFSN